MTLPAFIEATISAVMMQRRGPAGNQRGRDDDVDVLVLLGVQRRLAGLVVVAHLFGVAGGRDFGVLVRDGQVLAAEGGDLIGHLGPRVGGPHDRAEAARRADGSQAGDTGTDHEHLGRGHLARRGHLAGEEPAEAVGGLDHGAVAGDVGHRRQHVQRLGREIRGTASIASTVIGRADSFSTSSGLSAGESRLTRVAPVAQLADLGIIGRVDLEHDVGVPRPADLGTGVDVGSIGETRGSAGAGFYDYLIAELDNLSDSLRRGGDARFTSQDSRGIPMIIDFRSDLVGWAWKSVALHVE